MAGKKAVYEITINGVKESTSAIASLNKELDSLDRRLKNLQGAKVNIKVEGNSEAKAKVEGNGGNGQKQALNALAKLEEQVARERRKEESLVTEEYQKQYQQLEKIKAANKEAEQAQKQIAQGVRDTNGEYANTLAGQRAYLSYLQKAFNQLEIGTEEWEKASEELLRVRELVKQIEQGTGDYRRNVGNYPSGAKELVSLFNEYKGRIDAANASLAAMRDALSKASAGSAKWKELSDKIRQLEAELEDATKGAKELNEELGKKVAVGTGGALEYYDDLGQAAETLEKKLFKLQYEGKQGTAEWNETVASLGNVRVAMQRASAQVDSFVERSYGLRSTINIMNGLSSVASLGVGLQQLFGGESEELDETLRKFTALTLIMNGIATIQQQMNNEQDSFGKLLNVSYNNIKKMVGGIIGAIPGAKKLGEALKGIGGDFISKGNQIKSVIDLQSVEGEIAKVKASIAGMVEENPLLEAVGRLISKFDELSKVTASIKFGQNVDFSFADQEIQRIQKHVEAFKMMLADPVKANLSQDEVERMEALVSHLEARLSNLKSAKVSIDTGDSEAALKSMQEVLGSLRKDMKDSASMVSGESERLAGLTERLAQLREQGAEAAEAMGKTGQMLSRMGTFGKVAATALVGIGRAAKAATAAIKSLLASTVLLYVIQTALEAIMKLIDGAISMFKKLAGTDKAGLVKDFDGISASIDAARGRLEAFNAQLDRLNTGTAVGQLETLRKKAAETSGYVEQSAAALKEFVSEMENTKPLSLKEGFGSDAWFNSQATVKDMDAFRKRYETLVKAVSKGVDEMEAKTGSGGWLLTASDAATDLAEMQKALIADIQARINGIDFSKGEQAYKEFMAVITDELNASALANIGKLFPEDKWQQGLADRINAYRGFAEQLLSLNKEIGESSKELADTIAENSIQAIADPYKRQRAELKRSKEREIDEAEGNQELIRSINAKYRRLEKEAADAHYKEMAAKGKEAAAEALRRRADELQSEIDLMGEGFAKRKAQLELDKELAVGNAKAEGATKQTILNIAEKYDKDILQAEKEFSDEMLDLYSGRNEALLALETDYMQRITEVDRGVWDRQHEIRNEIEDLLHGNYKMDLEFGMGADFDESLANVSEYYSKLLAEEKGYNAKKKALAEESGEEDYNRLLEDEKDAWKERLGHYKAFLAERASSLDEALSKGLVTQQEHDEMMMEEESAVNRYVESEREEHEAALEQMEAEHRQRMFAIGEEYRRKDMEAEAARMDGMLSSLSDFNNSIGKEREAASKRNTSEIGIINYRKEKESLEKAKQEYARLMQEIAKQYEELKRKIENEEISFGDFKKAKGELDALSGEVQEKAREIDGSLKNLFNTAAQSIAESAGQYVSAFQSLYSSITSLQDVQLENQERKLEREQELLDEELAMLEEQYAKQEEVTQGHTDNINSIEEELKDARGDRREHLISQLAKEREAQLNSLETESQVAKEKEEAQKRQEQLEKRQEALEKKRWEQDKRNSVVQATINTYTAVTNALAVKPWFVGLALSAVALALGMANVAKIQSQKYYAKGGLLEGKPHSQGGIRIPGTGIEVEGGEYVVNKVSTRFNQPIIEYINSKKRVVTAEELLSLNLHKGVSSVKSKFADGGTLPSMDDINVRELVNYQQERDERPVVVSVVDIINASDNVREVQALAGA